MQFTEQALEFVRGITSGGPEAVSSAPVAQFQGLAKLVAIQGEPTLRNSVSPAGRPVNHPEAEDAPQFENRNAGFGRSERDGIGELGCLRGLRTGSAFGCAAGREEQGIVSAADVDSAGKLEQFAAFAAAGELEDAVNMLGSQLTGPGADFFGDQADDAGAHAVAFDSRIIRAEEIRDWDADALRILANDLGAAPAGKLLQERFFLTGQLSERNEMRNDVRLELFFQQRNKFVADSGAKAGDILVGDVFAPLLFFCAQIGPELSAADVQKGANGVGRLGMDGAETGEPRAAKDVGEHGFGLIFGGVRGGNAVHDALLDEASEERVAGAAGGILEIGFFAASTGGDVLAADVQGQAELFGEASDEGFVGVGGFSAQFVVEMGDAQDDAERVANFKEQEEQGDGVCAAGDGHGDALSRAEKFPALNLAEEKLSESGTHGGGVSLPSAPMVAAERGKLTSRGEPLRDGCTVRVRGGRVRPVQK